MRIAVSLLLSILALSLFGVSARAAEGEQPPGLGDPGKLMSISIETGRVKDGPVLLSGRDSSQQLVVTGHYDSGQQRDLTRDVTYTASPAGIVAVDATGHVASIKEGEATIQAAAGPGIDVTVRVRVANIEQDLPINFPNQITPLFTKYGCNSGGCHGKSGGQNGFALSLLGFEPSEDYEYLVKEGRGRRLFPSAPDQSLLLLKATARVPHGGGSRLTTDSPSYRLLVRWIQQGMPYGSPDAPRVTHIEVFPTERLMQRNGSQQLVVVAHYSDGSTEDVTRTTTFDSNDKEMAEVSATGLVSTSKLTGSVAVMARYQGQVGVFRATIPLGVPVENLPPAKNYIDELVFEKLKALGLPPSELSDDATFLRRVTLDVAGRLPTMAEAVEFAADGAADKRARWIDQLLAGTDYAEYFANKWNAILRNKRRAEGDKPATYAFYDWLRESLHENKPYDQIVREVLTASGEAGKNAPVAWYREVRDPSAQVEDTAQLFLGLRIQCARCHHHPFEKWSQQDYFGFQAFFAQVGRKNSAVRRPGADLPPPRNRPGAESQDRSNGQACRAGRTTAGDRPGRGSASCTGGMDDRQGEPVLCQGAGQSLLEALLRPRSGRPRRRHAGHQPGVESETVGGPGARLHRAPIRLEAPGAHDLQFPCVPAKCGAQSLERGRQTELLAVLPSAVGRRSPAGCHQPGDRDDQ